MSPRRAVDARMWLMNTAKLDPALLAELLSDSGSSEQRLSVFVRTDPVLSPDARATLRALGIDVGEGATIFSADLSRQQITQLSEQTWVRLIRLARAARPVSNT